MEIKDIKQQLSISQVLAHYGLQPDKHQRVLCPFHPDKTPYSRRKLVQRMKY